MRPLFTGLTPLSVEDRDDLQAWFDCLPALPLLSADEEAQATPDQLVAHNMRLVVPIASRYAGKGVALADLLQEGCIGLTKASRSFDAAKGYKFSTYASKPIAEHVIRAIHNQGNAIRIPVHALEGRDDNSAGVATAAARARQIYSIENTVFENDHYGNRTNEGASATPGHSALPDPNADTAAEVERIEEIHEARALAARAIAAMDCLEVGERAAFVGRYLDNLSVPEVAARTGYTIKSVRQLSYVARAKIRAALQREGMRHAS